MRKGEQKIRVGIMGIGFGQQVHIPAFRSDSRCDVVAICASTLERALNVAARHGVLRSYGDWRELVEDVDVDAISIAAPPSVQPEIAIRALSQGKAVFCEKPLALSKAAALEMTDAAEKARVANMVDFSFGEIEAWRRAKTVLDRGGVGNLRHIAVSWNVETYTNRMGSQSWKSCAEQGGGVLNSFVSHSFSYIEWFAGRIKRLSASLFRAPTDDRTGDTLALLCLELASGVPASLSISSHAFLGSGHHVKFYGDEGALVLGNTTSDYAAGWRMLHGTRALGRLRVVFQENPSQAITGDGRIRVVASLVRRFADWIETGVPSPPSFRDGLRVQALLEAARKSHELGRWVMGPF